MKAQETTCRGVARNVHWHDSPTRSKVLSFRVEVLDDDGNIERYVPVEADFIDVVDILVDSDEVEVTGRLRENGILRPRLIKNLRTGASIDAGRPAGRMKYLFALTLPFVLGGAGLFMSLGRSHGDGFGGLVTGFIAGCFLCIMSWLIMAVVDHRRRA